MKDICACLTNEIRGLEKMQQFSTGMRMLSSIMLETGHSAGQEGDELRIWKSSMMNRFSLTHGRNPLSYSLHKGSCGLTKGGMTSRERSCSARERLQ